MLQRAAQSVLHRDVVQGPPSDVDQSLCEALAAIDQGYFLDVGVRENAQNTLFDAVGNFFWTQTLFEAGRRYQTFTAIASPGDPRSDPKRSS